MAVLGLRFCARASLVAASEGHSSSQCTGLSLSRPLLLRDTGSRRAASVVVAHRPSCSAACGIFPDQGSNPCLLHWQADSQPLRHQGSLRVAFGGREERFIDYLWAFTFRSAFKYIQINFFIQHTIVISGLGIVLKSEGTKLNKIWSLASRNSLSNCKR